MPGARGRSTRRLPAALALAAAFGLLVVARAPAEAHALLVRADPPPNAQIREPPQQLTLYFSEPLERRFSRARVVDQDGNRLDERIEFDDADEASMRVIVKPPSPGFVTVFWETVSAVDGHRISGSYPLTILNPDGSLPAGQAPRAEVSIEGQDPEAARVIAKWVLLVAGSLLAGALGFLTFVTPGLPETGAAAVRASLERRSLQMAGASIALLVVAGMAELALQAADIGTDLGSTIDTSWGGRWLLRNLLLVQPVTGLLVGWMRPSLRRAGAAWALLGAAGYLAVTASVSHSAAGSGAFWGAAADFVHLLGASVWTGMLGLLVLLFLQARRLQAAERYGVLAAGLQRFSAVALVSVVALLFTGTFNALVEVGRLADLVDTGYGRALLAKLLLLLPLLGLALTNAFYLRPQLVETAEAPRTRGRESLLETLEGRLSRLLRFELGVAVAVLAVVALLVQLTPTRGRLSEPGQTAGPFTATQEAEGISATLVVDPNQPGQNTFEVYLAGAVDKVESVRLEFTSPGGFGGDSRLVLDLSNPPSFYVGQGAFLNEAGSWTVALNVRRVDKDLRMPFKVKVTAPGGAGASSRAGGSFDAPFEFGSAAVALLLVSGLGSAAFVVAGLPRRDLAGGYLGWLLEEASYRIPVYRLRSAWSLVLLIVVGVGLGVLAGAHTHSRTPADEASRENPVEATQESIARGRMLFASNCVQCHGESGRGDGPLAASLPLKPANLYDHVPFHPDQYFFGVISNGLGGVMPAFEGQLSEEDRWNILNFLRAQFTEAPASQ